MASVHRKNRFLFLVLVVFSAHVGLAGNLYSQDFWTNWESPPFHPLEKVPGTSLLLAVNTADSQL